MRYISSGFGAEEGGDRAYCRLKREFKTLYQKGVGLFFCVQNSYSHVRVRSNDCSFVNRVIREKIFGHLCANNWSECPEWLTFWKKWSLEPRISLKKIVKLLLNSLNKVWKVWFFIFDKNKYGPEYTSVIFQHFLDFSVPNPGLVLEN